MIKKVLIWLFATLVISHAYADVHKWVDAEGNIQYGDAPAEAGTSVIVRSNLSYSQDVPKTIKKAIASTKRQLNNAGLNAPIPASRAVEEKLPTPSFSVYGYGVGGNGDVGVGNSTTAEDARFRKGLQQEKAARQAMYDQMREEAKKGILPWQAISGGVINPTDGQVSTEPPPINPAPSPTQEPSYAPSFITDCDKSACFDGHGGTYIKSGEGTYIAPSGGLIFAQ